MEEKVQVILIEDDLEFTKNIKSCFNQLNDFNLSGTFESCETALKSPAFVNAEILLLDIKLPGIDGLQAIPLLTGKNPGLQIIIVSSFNHDEKLFKALKLGAKGYLLKSDCFQFLENAFLQTLMGGMLFSPEMAKKVLSHFKRRPLVKVHLTKREKEVLRLLKEGLTKKEIAFNLMISYGTVDTHVKNIYRKLHVNSNVQATQTASGSQIM